MKNIAPFIVLVAILVIIGIVLVNWFNFRLKKRLLDSRPADENILKLISNLWRPGTEGLKWGLLLLSGGIGLILADLVPADSGYNAIPYGIEAVCLSAGFITFYLIAKKDHEN